MPTNSYWQLMPRSMVRLVADLSCVYLGGLPETGLPFGLPFMSHVRRVLLRG